MRAKLQFAFLAIFVAAFMAAAAWAADGPASPPADQKPPPAQQKAAPAAAPKEAAPKEVAPKEAAPKEPAPPPSVTIIEAADARGVLGRDVRSPTAEDMGRIVDVIVDRAGHVRAAVIDFGGFLGVGSRKIVVDWNALHFGQIANKGESITLELTKDQVMAAPEYKEDKPIVVLGAAGTLQPFSP
jgi:hypothetical protein